MHCIPRLTWIVCLIVRCCFISGQEAGSQGGREGLRFMFYNVENLFDHLDDSCCNDEDFLPDGVRRWTFTRYQDKVQRIFQVIAAAGGWIPPEIIGLCEVENNHVIDRLMNHTGLSKYPYRYIHRDSDDERGMDVALLYRSDIMRPLSIRYIGYTKSRYDSTRTRDILCAQMLVRQSDTVTFLINHWPSRYGGVLESRKPRMKMARALCAFIDSLYKNNPRTKLVVAGDFNDERADDSMRLLTGENDPVLQGKNRLVHMISNPQDKQVGGSIKYQGVWYLFDQILVSPSMVASSSGLQTCHEYGTVFCPAFLLTGDESHTGLRPFRSYHGFQYEGGFSDHLPVILDLCYR